MGFGDTEILREEGDLRLLKIECRDASFSYCVVGGGSTRHYDDYDDALEEFNFRRMKAKFEN